MKKNSDLTDLILRPLDLGLKELNNFIQTFEQTEDSLAVHQTSLQKIHENFISYDLSTENPLSDLLSNLKSIFSCWSFSIYRFKNSLKLDILEPLRLFSENIRTMSKVFEFDIGTAEESLQTCTKKLTDCKSRYLKDAETLETLETQRLGSAPNKHNLQGTVSSQLVECLSAEKKLNESHEKFEKISFRLIENVKKNEESRMYFIKTSCEKFVHQLSGFLDTMVDKTKEMNSSLGKLNCVYRADECYAKLNELIPPKLAFETYNSWKYKNRTVDMVEDSLIVNSTIDLLINKKSSEQASIERLLEIVETFEGQEWFFRVLEQKMTGSSIGHYEITKLGEIFIRILSILPKIERSYRIFYHIINISEQIWTNHQNYKKFLYEFLMADPGLLDEARWSFLIQSDIEERCAKEILINNRMKKRAKSRGFFESIKKINFLAKDSFEVTQEDIRKKVAREVLMNYSSKLWKFKVDPNTSNSIIMYFVPQFDIDSESLAEMLALIRPAREYYQSRRKLKIIDKKMIFKEILPYLALRDQIEIIKVSKTVHSSLSERVYKNFLMNPRKKNLKIREFLWTKILKPYFPSHLYSNILIEMSVNKNSLLKLRKVIKLDVIRSCQCKETQKKIRRILKAYAHFNKHVGYCQGMNFIVSAFYSIFKDEEKTYYCLYAFIQKFKMQGVLADNLLGLKCLLYKFDKLVELKIPKIYKIFVATGACTSNFASSWFLTAFSSSLCDKLDFLYEIWDLFFVKEWKIIFQVSLVFLKVQQKNIMDFYFAENTVNLSSEKIIAYGLQVKNLLKTARDFQVSKKHLDLIQQDYLKILNDSKQFVC